MRGPIDGGEGDVGRNGLGFRLDDLLRRLVLEVEIGGQIVGGAAPVLLVCGTHSTMPVTSGVCHARCWPPSSAIIWPVTDRAAQR